MRISRSATLLAAVSTIGCLGGEGSPAQDVGVTRGAIVGGTNVLAGENGSPPYSAVVKFTLDPGGSGGIDECNGLKLSAGTGGAASPDRYLTAAHCVEHFSGGTANIFITNALDPAANRGLRHRVDKIYMHPTWRLFRANQALVGSDRVRRFGDQFDIALVDAHVLQGSPNTIPSNNTFWPNYAATPGHIMRLVGYGPNEAGVSIKRWGDNATAAIPSGTTDPLFDIPALRVTHFFRFGLPYTLPGDSGSPVLSTVTPPNFPWEILGVLSGSAPGSSQSDRVSRTGSVRLWFDKPVPNALLAFEPATGTNLPGNSAPGRLINARYAKCMTMWTGDTLAIAADYSCFGDPDSTSHNQYWRTQKVATNQYRIANGFSGKCLQPDSANPTSNDVVQRPCNSANFSQLWEFREDNNDLNGVGSGTVVPGISVHQIRNVGAGNPGTGRCITAVVGQGTNIKHAACADDDLSAQEWVFTP